MKEPGTWEWSTGPKARSQHYCVDATQVALCGADVTLSINKELPHCKKCEKKLAEIVKTAEPEKKPDVPKEKPKVKKEKEAPKGKASTPQKKFIEKIQETLGKKDTAHEGPRHSHEYCREISDEEYRDLKGQVKILLSGAGQRARILVKKIDAMEKAGFRHAPKRMRYELAVLVSNPNKRRAIAGGSEKQEVYSPKEILAAKKKIER